MEKMLPVWLKEETTHCSKWDEIPFAHLVKWTLRGDVDYK